MAEKYDLIVLGSGPGGYVAAIRGAQLGLKVAIVERELLGGICLNWGCIPTKALLRSAEIFHTMNHADDYGLSAKSVGFDLKKVVKRSRGISDQLNKGVGFLLKKNKVAVIDGEAKLNGPGKVDVAGNDGNKQTLTAKHVIVATGARPRTLPGLEPDGKQVWTYFEALVPDTMPKSLLVIGSGAIGIEFASFFNTLGAKVTVIEVLERILPVEDAEIAALAHKQFESQGMTIITGARVTGLKKTKASVTAAVEDADGNKTEIKVERVISAVGVQGNIEGIGLETTKVKTDCGGIVVDEFSRTNEPGVYAIDDVAGPPLLAHKAEHEGVICIEKIAGLSPHPLDKGQVPGCTYCRPQIASIGMTETDGNISSSAELIQQADLAMYQAKQLGRNTWQWFEEAMNSQASYRVKLRNQLQDAIDNQALTLYYQPMIDSRTGQARSVEALVRWQHPERGLLYPRDFLPLAEETKLIAKLSECVLDQACHDVGQWIREGHSDLRLAVNLSPVQVEHPRFVDTLMAQLQAHGFPPQNLEIEITENVIMNDLEQISQKLRELASLGVRIAIDDFGTGYSSLNYIHRLPIHTLKVDQSFVKAIRRGEDGACIVNAIVAMAHGLKLQIVAEGVETDEQLTYLKSLGCHQVQGFFYGPARPADVISKTLGHTPARAVAF